MTVVSPIPFVLHCANHLYAASRGSNIKQTTYWICLPGFRGENLNLAICNIFARALLRINPPPGHHGNVKTNCAHQLSPGEKTRRRHSVMTSPENPSECSVSSAAHQLTWVQIWVSSECSSECWVSSAADQLLTYFSNVAPCASLQWLSRGAPLLHCWDLVMFQPRLEDQTSFGQTVKNYISETRVTEDLIWKS